METRRRRNLKDLILTNPDQKKKKSQRFHINIFRLREGEISKISYLQIQTRRRRNLKDFLLTNAYQEKKKSQRFHTYKSRLTEEEISRVSYF